ncbi:hypothetical protein BASA82_001030 [Batrachochytrium salamandrivorans]|nr:hypothetical protein BASA81_004650 [Batrachochytrium salamandrivorans]KAH9261325.1 hypothetical protein BASA82_001030 [Batrachochytrium salamandrivorans]KAJ1343096.1 hypothetical protein BSLG_002122 [Batrachochytrium salamandrivorans]
MFFCAPPSFGPGTPPLCCPIPAQPHEDCITTTVAPNGSTQAAVPNDTPATTWHRRIVQLNLRSVPGFTQRLPLPSAVFYVAATLSDTPTSLSSSSQTSISTPSSTVTTTTAPFLLTAGAAASHVQLKPVYSAASLVRINAANPEPPGAEIVATTAAGHAIASISISISGSGRDSNGDSIGTPCQRHSQAIFKPSHLFDNAIERETLLYRHMRTTHSLDAVVGQILFSGFSTALPPLDRRRSRHVELCRVLLVSLAVGIPPFDPHLALFTNAGIAATRTGWSSELCTAITAAYQTLWTHGVLHRAVDRRNILFATSTNGRVAVHILNFETAVLAHERYLYNDDWNVEVSRERLAVEAMCTANQCE